MANAKRTFNNLRGWLADVAAARREAADGNREAGELLDRLCDDLDMLLDFGVEDDADGDGGHAEGSSDTEAPDDVAEPDVDTRRMRRDAVAAPEQARTQLEFRTRGWKPRTYREAALLPGADRRRRGGE